MVTKWTNIKLKWIFSSIQYSPINVKYFRKFKIKEIHEEYETSCQFLTHFEWLYRCVPCNTCPAPLKLPAGCSQWRDKTFWRGRGQASWKFPVHYMCNTGKLFIIESILNCRCKAFTTESWSSLYKLDHFHNCLNL